MVGHPEKLYHPGNGQGETLCFGVFGFEEYSVGYSSKEKSLIVKIRK